MQKDVDARYSFCTEIVTVIELYYWKAVVNILLQWSLV